MRIPLDLLELQAAMAVLLIRDGHFCTWRQGRCAGLGKTDAIGSSSACGLNGQLEDAIPLACTWRATVPGSSRTGKNDVR